MQSELVGCFGMRDEAYRMFDEAFLTSEERKLRRVERGAARGLWKIRSHGPYAIGLKRRSPEGGEMLLMVMAWPTVLRIRVSKP